MSPPSEAVAFVDDAGPNVAATITPQHLHINRNAMLAGGIRPHAYCLPVAKREKHRLALRKAATSGSRKYFLGTDSSAARQALQRTRLRLRGHLQRALRAGELPGGVRGRRRAGPVRGFRFGKRARFLRLAAQLWHDLAGASSRRSPGCSSMPTEPRSCRSTRAKPSAGGLRT